MDNQPIVLERMLKAPVSNVWKALTETEEIGKWYFDLAEFTPEIGFKFQFPGGPDPARQYLHLCEVTEAVSERKLTYSWRYDGYSGISFVTFELFPQNNKTLLIFTHKGIGTFPEDNPDFSRGNFVEGWNHIIHNSLNNYLENK